ncbi:hypothetical protein [Pedomonas mirosovicensis]|uniref:hypothetical protein n=1 Tax=Pedomonas mirosovicensis TaxID=2908641 RepID=UPI0021686725|nr:hypothetical protein [Pedomonas mirosovicensis]MCH8685937.1 hypothetical protein [Pedomonas mirosovicensis]
MGRIIIVAVLLALLAAVVTFVVVAWRSMGEVHISGVGIGALIAGVVLSVLVGGGLMALVFYSSRRGYDDRASTDSRRGEPRD